MPSHAGPNITERRRARRLSVEHEAEAFVQFDLVGRSRWKLSLVEISALGVGFRLENGRPSLAIGTELDKVTLNVVGLRIVGKIRVAHVTRKPGEDIYCGAEFYPSTEGEQRTLALVLSSLDKRSPQSN